MATILVWKNLLKPDKYKDVIAGSLTTMFTKKWVEVNAFVIQELM
ncbi:MAG TPA: hypothetical protein VGP55_00990 [Chitinophagaceae bacterium]|nr:hypothetical protein [Chitinophagaceae bacterium]